MCAAEERARELSALLNFDPEKTPLQTKQAIFRYVIRFFKKKKKKKIRKMLIHFFERLLKGKETPLPENIDDYVTAEAVQVCVWRRENIIVVSFFS